MAAIAQKQTEKNQRRQVFVAGSLYGNTNGSWTYSNIFGKFRKLQTWDCELYWKSKSWSIETLAFFLFSEAEPNGQVAQTALFEEFIPCAAYQKDHSTEFENSIQVNNQMWDLHR